MEQDINFSKIAYFPFPAIGHFIGYKYLFNFLSEKHGVDIYINKGKFEANFSNVIRLKSKEHVQIDNLTIINAFESVFELCYDAIGEIDEMWSKANYKPKLIITDVFGFHGSILAKKYNIPAISLYSAFPVYKEQLEYLFKSCFLDPTYPEKIVNIANYNEKIEKVHGVNLRNINGLPDLNNLIDFAAILSNSPPEYPHLERHENFTFCGTMLREEKVGVSFDFEKHQNKKFVFISLGTVFNFNPKFFEKVIDCFNQYLSETYVLLVSIANADLKEKLSLSVDFELLEKKGLFINSYWNQIEILEKCDVFLTHGGHNSYLEAMYRECPMICFPQAVDQFSVALEIKRLGFGEVIDENITIESFAATIKKIVEDPSYKNNLAGCSSWFNNQRVLENYLKIIEKYL